MPAHVAHGHDVVRTLLALAVALPACAASTQPESHDPVDTPASHRVESEPAPAPSPTGVGTAGVADTNASPAQLARLIDVAGLRDACEVVDCPEPGRIERLLVRGSPDLDVQVTAWRNEPAFFDTAGVPLSDHPAVSAEIAWRIVSR